jgi:uncharacterized protein
MPGVIIKKLTDKEEQKLGIKTWSVWEKGISRFNWTYSQQEQCYIIKGEFVVETDDGSFKINAGDYVIFERGLNCVWDIKVPVKKYFNFS